MIDSNTEAIADIALTFDYACSDPEGAVDMARRLHKEATRMAPDFPPATVAKIAARFITRRNAPPIQWQFYELSLRGQLQQATLAAINLLKAASKPPDEYHGDSMKSLFGLVDFDEAMRSLMPKLRTKRKRWRRFREFLVEMRGVDDLGDDDKRRVILKQTLWVREMKRAGIPQHVFDATKREFEGWWDKKKRKQKAESGHAGYLAMKKSKKKSA